MILYQTSIKSITPSQLTGFFHGWPAPPSPERHLDILNNSAHIVLAVDTETVRVVGYITAITDGVLAAYIPLLEVLPEYRKRGIGSELLGRMLGILDRYYMVDIVCDEDLSPFYRRHGLTSSCAMIKRNRNAQSGRDIG